MIKENLLERISCKLPVLIAGPTAIGKSAIAAKLAARDKRIIINADALQVYENWRILTARPSKSDESALPHALYGHISREHPYSVGEWLKDIARIFEKTPPHKVVIIGGTGLYFSALTEGLAEIPPISPDIKNTADQLRKSDYHQMVSELDPKTAAKTDLANPMRVQRAWEVLKQTGKGLAQWHNKTPKSLLPPDICQKIVLEMPTERLNQRIEKRFHQMVLTGAIEEAASELPYWNPSRPSAKAIGAFELISYIKGDISLQEAQKAAVIATQKYAKRQRTWFRNRMKKWERIDVG